MKLVQHAQSISFCLAAGIKGLLNGFESFKQLEDGVYEMIHEAAREMLKTALEELDGELLESRPKQLAVVCFKTRTLITPFGDIEFKRRYYKDAVTGERRLLLDEALGLVHRQRLSPKMRAMAIELAPEMSYHQAAKVMEQLAPHVSPMAVWTVIQEVGACLEEQADVARQEVFEDGFIPDGKREAKELNVEADGTFIRMRGGGKKEMKLIVAYEGKEQVNSSKSVPRYSLKGRRVITCMGSQEKVWEQAVAELARHWDLTRIQKCAVGGDGAAWPKAGCEYLPNASYHLDRYHLRKALTQSLSHDVESHTAVTTAIASGNLDCTKQALIDAAGKSSDRERKAVNELTNYILNNWEGIQNSESTKNLGAIEGQVYHQIAARMKRRGASWSEDGAKHMGRLLSSRANGELDLVANVEPVKRPKQTIRTYRAKIAPNKLDSGEWLKAHMPCLIGPSAGSPWVKYVMKNLACAGAWF